MAEFVDRFGQFSVTNLRGFGRRLQVTNPTNVSLAEIRAGGSGFWLLYVSMEDTDTQHWTVQDANGATWTVGPTEATENSWVTSDTAIEAEFYFGEWNGVGLDPDRSHWVRLRGADYRIHWLQEPLFVPAGKSLYFSGSSAVDSTYITFIAYEVP